MKNSEYYVALPESMSVEELTREFLDVLDSVSEDSNGRCDALTELSDRQWHSYERMESGLRSKVSEVLKCLWLDDDLDRASRILGIVGRLGLPEVLTFVTSRSDRLAPEIAQCVIEAVAEFGSTVDDPYAGMK